jgi:hypothetical protein
LTSWLLPIIFAKRNILVVNKSSLTHS